MQNRPHLFATSHASHAVDSHAHALVLSRIIFTHICRAVDFIHASLDAWHTQRPGAFRTSQSGRFRDGFHMPRSASHSKNGQPFMVCQYRMIRFNSVIYFKSPSSPPSTDLHDQCLVFIRQHHEVVAVVEQSDVLAGVFAQAGMQLSNLELHFRQCVHDDRWEIRRRVSCSVRALEQQSTSTCSLFLKATPQKFVFWMAKRSERC